jgi:hypothetical protein
MQLLKHSFSSFSVSVVPARQRDILFNISFVVQINRNLWVSVFAYCEDLC